MSSTEDGLDPRVVRTRRLLEQSFMELLEEKGFQSLTVRDITERATVNRATFYAHFDDKYALLDYVIRESFQEMLDKKLPPGSDFSLENLRILILTVCEYLAHFHRHQCVTVTKQFEPLMEKEVQNQVYDQVLRWIVDEQKKRAGADVTVSNNTEPEVTASAVSWAIFGASLQWSRDSSRHTAEQISDQVLFLLIRGMDGAAAQALPRVRQR